MASSLLALIDDIATILDDVAVMSKVAAKKTAGVLGDDLALNAQQVSGVNPDRELPVVWAVAKGSFVNKAILVPAALVVSSFAPWAVTPLLMIGGAFLCYEGFEKLAHKYLHRNEAEANEQQLAAALADESVDMVALEKDKIKGAIRTDFILSAEIIVISLGTVAAATFSERVLVLSTIALVMTAGVYGLVAAIVKLDDAGLYLSKRANGAAKRFGDLLLLMAPKLMKTLSVVGTAAMFMVGGSILLHGVHALAGMVDAAAVAAGTVPAIGAALKMVTPTVIDLVAGVIAGGVVLLVVTMIQKMFKRGKVAAH